VNKCHHSSSELGPRPRRTRGVGQTVLLRASVQGALVLAGEVEMERRMNQHGHRSCSPRTADASWTLPDPIPNLLRQLTPRPAASATRAGRPSPRISGLLLVVALDDVWSSSLRPIGISAGVAKRPPLTEEIPALVERDSDLLQPPSIGVARGSGRRDASTTPHRAHVARAARAHPHPRPLEECAFIQTVKLRCLNRVVRPRCLYHLLRRVGPPTA
jgi:hypothetical protein